ncbi:MAG: PD-(D/E)XK nuclease family protein [Candidatus Thermoplasmatota archaeon]|nr:PD-(D/E)XK nuclease family protein [Candidatus Thermoplasmatota archaeon]
MPVRTYNAEATGVDPFRRLSASQVNLWKSCPRQWYYAYEVRLKGPMPPHIIRGNAAEECICRVLRDSPSLITPEAPDTLISPLNEDGAPDWEDEQKWMAARLSARPSEDWPTSREALMEWAIARVEVHFDRCWDAAVEDWQATQNRAGSLEDIEPEECREMILEGIRMHLDEVEKCLEANGGPNLKSWRAGEARDEIPAPDGFPLHWKTPHPSAQGHGEMTWCEAWELARPWFVDPDSKSFSQTTCIPEGWFQGEYDLVYRWDGSINIVDIKASIGKGDRSFSYMEQLRLYAWLWWESHARSEQVSSLEIWYLGTGTAKSVEIPQFSELEAYESDLGELYQLLRAGNPSIDKCPPNPAPLRHFDAGGVPAEQHIDSDPLARCKGCDYRGFCPKGDHDLELTEERRIERLGHAWPITPLGEIEPRVEAIGEVIGLSGPELLEDDTIKVHFRLQDGYDRAKVQPAYNGGPKRISRSIAEGVRVKVSNALPSLWRGELQLNLDADSEVSLAEEDETASVVDVETRVSIIARVWSIDSFPDGVGNTRWAATLVDATGSAQIVAFKQFVPLSAAAVKRGDTIAILNGEKGEWGGRPQVKCGPGSKVVIVSDAEDVPEF